MNACFYLSTNLLRIVIATLLLVEAFALACLRSALCAMIAFLCDGGFPRSANGEFPFLCRSLTPRGRSLCVMVMVLLDDANNVSVGGREK